VKAAEATVEKKLEAERKLLVVEKGGGPPFGIESEGVTKPSSKGGS